MDPSSTLSHCRNSSIEQTAIFYSWFKRMLTFCGYIPGTASSLPRDMDGGSCRAHLPSILCTPFSAVYHTPSTAHHRSLTVSEEGSFPSAVSLRKGEGRHSPGQCFCTLQHPQAGWLSTHNRHRCPSNRILVTFFKESFSLPTSLPLMWIRQHLVPASGVMTTAQGRTEAPAGPSGTRTPPDRRACQLACGHLTRQ